MRLESGQAYRRSGSFCVGRWNILSDFLLPVAGHSLMPEEKKQISPEEKLLQLIQEGEQSEREARIVEEERLDEQAETIAVAAAPVELSEPPAEALVADSPALKLAEPELPMQEAAVSAAVEREELIGVQVAAATAEAHVPPPSSPVAQKQVDRRFGLTTLNRCLAVAVLVVICFAGFEVWSSVLSIQAAPPPPRGGVVLAPESDYDLPPIAEILKAWESHPIIHNVEQVDQVIVDVKPPDRGKQHGWMKFAQDSLDLIGMSDGEAIIVDKSKGKMFFLKVGGELEFRQQKLKLERIDADQVVLTDGKDKLMVK